MNKKLLISALVGIGLLSHAGSPICRRYKDDFILLRRARLPSTEISPAIIAQGRVLGHTLNWLMRPKAEANYIVTPDIRDILTSEPELSAVIMGVSPIAVLDSPQAKVKIEEIKYNLWALGISQGIHINVMELQDGRVCIYNEDYLRSLLYKDGIPAEKRFIGATKTGLELLIKQDILRGEGIFSDLVKRTLSEAAKRETAQLMKNVFESQGMFDSEEELGVGVIVICTFGRPDGLRRALDIQTENMEIFGHKKQISFLIIDDTPVDSAEQRETVEIIDEFRGKGFDIKYVGRDRHMEITNAISSYLLQKYSAGQVDSRLLEEIRNPVTGEIDARKLFEIIEVILAAKNIAAARTFSILMTNGRMMNIDDDAFPTAAVVSREDLTTIMNERQTKVAEQMQKMYRELSALQGVGQIATGADFERFLATRRAEQPDAQQILAKYYAYSPDGSTGLIPQAASEIVPNTEARLRFNRLFDERYAEKGATHFVAVEDAVIRDMAKGHYKIPQDNYSFLHLDYVRIFNRTLGQPVGSPEAGKVLTFDHRGINGIVGEDSLDELGRRVVLATSHFNNARDLSAEALITEAIRYWVREWDIENQEVVFNPQHRPDIADMQQVVGQAVHLGTYASTSTGFDKTNQYCFNTTSMDLPYPLPTTGGWLRIEEPFFKPLVEFITGGTQSWTSAMGGHRRIPAERRPRVDRQLLWEEMAMILYPTLDRIFVQLGGLPDKSLVDSPDAVFEARLRELGYAYLRESRVFTLTENDEKTLLETRQRVARIANELWKIAESWEPGIIRTELKELATRLAEQFGLSAYTLAVSSDGKEIAASRREPYGTYDWKTGREDFQWPDKPSWSGGLAFADLERAQTTGELIIPGGDRVTLDAAVLSEMTVEALKPRHLGPGGSIIFFYPSDRLESDYFEKVTKYIRQQLEYDGLMLLFWPDIVEAMRKLGI